MKSSMNYILQNLISLLVIDWAFVFPKATLSKAQNQFIHASVKHDFIHLS